MALESLGDEGAGQQSATHLAGTDGRSESRSWQPFVGHLDSTATAGWSTSALSSESGGCVAVGGFDSRAEMPLTKTFVAAET